MRASGHRDHLKIELSRARRGGFWLDLQIIPIAESPIAGTQCPHRRFRHSHGIL